MGELWLAARRLRQRPAATTASIVTLACSIGAAAATWSVLSAVLLRPLPVRNVDSLFVIGVQAHRAGFRQQDSHSYPEAQYIHGAGAFERVVTGGRGQGRLLAAANGRPAVATEIYFASHGWFEVLGVDLPMGRGFGIEDDRRGAGLTAILSDAYWRRVFDADAGVIGRVLTVSGVQATIVGVLPRGFRGIDLSTYPEIYLPVDTIDQVSSRMMNFFGEANHQSGPQGWLTVIGSIQNGTGVDAALARLPFPPLPDGRVVADYRATPLAVAALPLPSRASIQQFGRLLGATVGLLILIGCTTVGMLVLVRTEWRRTELAMCVALGAPRRRLVGGVVAEGAILAAAGCVLALPCASMIFAALRGFELPGGVGLDRLSLSIDWPVVFAASVVAGVAALLIGIVAAGFGVPAGAAGALHARSDATPRRERRVLRTTLVSVQVAITLLFLTGALLFARSLSAALQLNPGFELDRIVTASLSLGSYGYTPARAAAFGDELVTRLMANPLIESAARTSFTVGMGPGGQLTVDDQPRRFDSLVSFVAVDERYFATLGLSIVAGRPFLREERSAQAPVAIVSASLARAIAGNASAIGHSILRPDGRKPAVEIVGVVPDLVTRVTVLEPLTVYLPMELADHAGVDLTVRAPEGAAVAAGEIRRAAASLDAAVALASVGSMEQSILRQMAPQQFAGVVLGVLALIAVILTALSTFVLAETMAGFRRREMGIRAALGATPANLARMALLEPTRYVAIGLVVGLAAAYAVSNAVRSFLFQVQPLDGVAIATATGAVVVIALFVSLRPALRLARVDVAAVLRDS